jgi:hypothetical protein
MTIVPDPHLRPSLLLYTRTDVPHHPSLVAGARALRGIAESNGFCVTHTEDPACFADPANGRPDAIVFLNTACDELDDAQRNAFARLVRAGSGFVGIHSASYFERDWPWYERLVGARFAGHPEPQHARVDVIDREHPATRQLPMRWPCFDEWYNFRTPPAGVRVLATLDESTYYGGAHGATHPVIWCRSVDGSRSFYTALGHTEECFANDAYLAHVLGAMQWAAGLER